MDLADSSGARVALHGSEQQSGKSYSPESGDAGAGAVGESFIREWCASKKAVALPRGPARAHHGAPVKPPLASVASQMVGCKRQREFARLARART